MPAPLALPTGVGLAAGSGWGFLTPGRWSLCIPGRVHLAVGCFLAVEPSCLATHSTAFCSAGEFKQRLEDEFDYSVAPLVFDLELRIDPGSLAAPTGQEESAPPEGWEFAERQDVPAAVPEPAASGAGGWRVVAVYGSPETDERRLSGGGSIMRVRGRSPF